MGKKILDSKALYIVLSILLSVGLWFYVMSLEGNEIEQSFSGIPVRFEGVDILEEKGLMIVGNTPTVSVRVKGPINTLAKLSSENIVVTVSVSQISSEGETTLGYNVSFPSAQSGSVTKVSQSPNNVTFTVARYLEREIPVTGRFTGTVADGFVPGGAQDFKFSPATVTVSGEASQVNQIRDVLVTVGGEGLTDSIAEDRPFDLIGNDESILEDLNVTCSVDTVYATFPIRATKEVPLKVDLVDGGGVSGSSSNVVCLIEPKSITVAGSREDVDAINEILLRSFDLSSVRSGDVFTVEIPLRDELENLSGTKDATVTFRFAGVTTKSVETTNINCINAPEGWVPILVTQAVTVELRGTAAALAQISGENVQVVVDLSKVTQAVGQYTLTPKIYLDNVGSNAGWMDNDYRVVISLSRAEQ